MDEADQHQILQTLNQFIKSKVVRKVTPLLISVSMFTFFFSYSFLLHSSNFNFSTFPFQKMFSYTTDKNCIFLLCNGILVFLARNSRLITSSPSGSDYNDLDFLKKNIGDYNSSPSESLISESKALLSMDKEGVMESNIVSQEIVVVEKRRENDEYLIQGSGEEEIEKSIVVYEEAAVTENEEKEKDPAESVLYLEDEKYYYDGDDEEEESLSTEELNKKFDDFIRRMKEDIRMQSQQLILV